MPAASVIVELECCAVFGIISAGFPCDMAVCVLPLPFNEMPAPAPFPSPFPALYLYPLNDSFIPKHIALLHNQHVKIGRQTNAKTTPGERNGYFDSKVLSRQHAEVWEEGNKVRPIFCP